MARELIIRELCDVCLGERDEKVDGQLTPPLYLANPSGKTLKPRVLTLCPEHWAVWEPLRAWLEAYGQTLDDAGNPTGHAGFRPPEVRHPGADKNPGRKQMRQVVGPFQCEWYGCTARPNKNLSAFAQHVYARHGSNLTDYRARFGEPRLVQQPPVDQLVDDVSNPDGCPVPGCPYTTTGLRKPAQGLAGHMRMKHPDLAERPASLSDGGQAQLDVG